MDFSTDTHLQRIVSDFLDRYGKSGLEQALQLYQNTQPEYICKTKTSIFRIKFCDIYYLEIRGHHIDVHTSQGTFQKYGSLSKELTILSPHGFTKCNQSCIVSLEKIQSIKDDSILLTNQERLHLSRHYTKKILLAVS